ncbi:response regulator [Consotaella salsifontis]|uniref:Regulatory protein VirG n=1 Tax=Consotaella salsifontis TaxID=1365950 RepID=A0A1T4RN26_9HYPH|nr:response regulator [Consotaella salsifontis]SKA17148.1 two-component system, OmpR family, response regulator [Consotaella salsifontis]
MEASPHVLIVDDHRDIRDLVGKFLSKHGLRITQAANGTEMWQALSNHRIDLIVLDLMLPGEDGLSLCRRLRAEGATTPVIMLTAMGEETDRVVGLEMGADDYMAKPFSSRELLARIKAVLRRTQMNAAAAAVVPTVGDERAIARFTGWTLDLARHDLHRADGVVLPLSKGEYTLLVAFVERPKRVLSRDQLLDLARGRSAIPFDRSIDTQVSRLRRKLEDDPANPTLIKTVWGDGYMFTADVSFDDHQS